MSKCIWARWDKNTGRLICIDPTARAGERCAICCHYREQKRRKEKEKDNEKIEGEGL